VRTRERGTPRIALASLEDLSSLYNWHNLFSRFRRHGCITPLGVYKRNSMVFHERVNGEYVMHHRPRDWIVLIMAPTSQTFELLILKTSNIGITTRS